MIRQVTELEAAGGRALIGRGPSGIAPVLQVHPTRRCNLACAHCYSSSGPGGRPALELDRLTACLEDAALLGYRQLSVSGGEPLLYDGLAELLTRARALGMLTSVTSNGMLAAADPWQPLAPLIDVAAISIDGTPSEHDALRRRTGAFVAMARNLDAIRASGVPFSIRFTLTHHNVDSLDFVVHFAAHSGARSVQVHPLRPHGRAGSELPASRPGSVELAHALVEAGRLGRELGVAVHVDALTVEQIRGNRSALVPARPVTDIAAVAPVLVVDADATVVPLTHEVSPRLSLGSLEHARLTVLVRDWLRAGRGDSLADACARTWSELTSASLRSAVHWFDEVAVRTRRAMSSRRAVLQACM